MEVHQPYSTMLNVDYHIKVAIFINASSSGLNSVTEVQQTLDYNNE